MNSILYAIALFMLTLLFFALDFWDRSQEGSGFQGLGKLIKRLGKVLVYVCGAFILLMGISAFSATGFWAGMFGLLLLPNTGSICMPLSFATLAFFAYVFLNNRSR